MALATDIHNWTFGRADPVTTRSDGPNVAN
jgi:hypothetical protein